MSPSTASGPHLSRPLVGGRFLPHELGGTIVFNLLAAAGMAASLLVAPAAPAAPEAPTPEGITFSVVTVNGSGCPAGSTRVRTSPDGTSFSVLYSDFVAEDGAHAGATEFRKNCQLNLLVSIPQGFSYAIAQVDYRGHARLYSGASATQSAYYYFTGQSATAETNYSLSGPYSGRWTNSDAAEVAVYSPCAEQTNFNINADLRVRAGSAEASRNWISMDRAHGEVENIYHLSWKRC
ncbi:DUF4360 domain-containing protein [Jidongwangia harbinensis]|uniref:DUF4360 domain-containing protein n=1 Tax=Jidongwangia harbinensis TaxID=2878561 RepID=UPI001CD94265|nr:DUF4360 domain-containing protein [Jidongwangia harbinensis]MCA2213297.1 DUF4360 domain-containing protein [Jidongwangia harbinensis]